MKAIRHLLVLLSVPFLMAADDSGCSGDQPIGSNNDAPSVPNPTGDCQASGNGAHECYSVPGPGDSWMPDCEAPLQRSYWRVYAFPVEEGTRQTPTGYMIPRPDGTGAAFGICGGSDAALDTLFRDYGLCADFLDAQGVERINNAPIADLLTIAHALHERLSFEAVDAGDSYLVTPFLLPADVRDGCPLANNASLSSKCTTYVDAACGPTDIGVVFDLDETEAGDLAAALNQLYGIQ